MMKTFTEKQKTGLRRAAIRFGEDLMPSDCANIIERRYCRSTRQKIGIRGIARMIIDMMEASSFCCEKNYALSEAQYLI